MLPARLSPRLLALLAAGAGVVAALGFAPWNIWPLSIIGIAALFWLVDIAPSRRSAVLVGWLFGTGHFTFGLGWIAHAFTYQSKMPPALGWVTVVGLAMFLALYAGLAAGLARALAVSPLARVAVFASTWMLGEWLRGWVLTGFAWNPLGAAWLPAPGVAQLAAYGGALSLSGLAMLAGGGLWLLLRAGAVRTERLAALAIGLGVVVAGAMGVLREAGLPPATGPMVYLVQPDIGQDERYLEGSDAAHLNKYLALTAAALARRALPQGALVLWSEGAVPYLVEEDAGVRAALASVLGPRDLLLFGGTAAIRDARGEATALTNSLYVIDAAGVLRGRYDKAHLVPLGEYVPAKALMTALGVARLVPGDLEFHPGPGPRTLALPGFPAAAMQICYEIIFPGAVVDAAHRPAWIANVSNDAWYGPDGPPQHLAQARLRAIEEGLPIARATPTGVSAMIDAHGHVSGALALGTQGVSTVQLPAALPATLFARFGHLVALGFGLALLATGLAVDRRSRRFNT